MSELAGIGKRQGRRESEKGPLQDSKEEANPGAEIKNITTGGMNFRQKPVS